MKPYILFTDSYTNNPENYYNPENYNPEKKSSHKFILTYIFRSSGYWTTPMQDKLGKKKEIEYVFPFVGKHTKMAL